MIDKVIAEYHCVETESVRHDEIASSQSQFFIGRENDLKVIDDYINDINANHALWLRCESGAGKSSLIAQIYQRYRDRNNVICRFCGATDQSVNGIELLNSIWTEMNLYNPLVKWVDKTLPQPGEKRRFGLRTVTAMFNSRLKQINEEKPLLILVDGLNQLYEDDSEECFALKWLDCQLSQHVRVIFTSTLDKRIGSSDLKHIKLYKLSPLPQNDAMSIVRGRLLRNKRTLTENQWNVVENVVSKGDKLPVYLTLLAKFLDNVASYEELPELPTDFTNLLHLLLKKLTSSHNHDPELVRGALTMLCCERQGLSHAEMLNALSLDDRLMRHLQDNAHHPIKGKVTPPILWSRLYNDLESLFMMRHSKLGHLISIYHEAVTNAIRKIYLTDGKDRAAVYKNLLNLYQKKETHHALHEINYCDYMYNVLKHNVGHNEEVDLTDLLARCQNPNFLYSKLMLDRRDLLNDFDLMFELTKISNLFDRHFVLNLKKDLASVIPCTFEQFLLLCNNAHPQSPLRKMAESANVLYNELNALEPYNLTVYAFRNSGVNPLISADGTRLLSLSQNMYRVMVEDIDCLTDSRQYYTSIPIVCFAATPDLSIHAFATKEGGQIYDYLNKKTLVYDRQIKSATWITVSSDGKKWAYGNEHQCYLEGFGLQEWGCRTARISPSGRYIWYSTEKGICRFDMLERQTKTLKPDNYKADAVKLELIAVDEDKCLLQNNDFILAMALDKNGTLCYAGYQYRYEQKQFIGGIYKNRFVSVELDYGKCVVYGFDGNCVDFVIDTTTYNIDALSSNLAFAYEREQKLCYDFALLLQSFKVYNEFNVGINTISCCDDGNLIAVTCGKNEIYDSCNYIYIIYNGVGQKVNLHQYLKSCYPMSCVVSPEGDCIWVSGCMEDDDMLCLNPQGEIIARITKAGSKLAMRFSHDGKRLIAVCGHHIADKDPLFHVIDACSKTVIAEFLPDGMTGIVGVDNSYDMELSSSGRYAIFYKFGKNHVVDIEKQKLLSEDESDIIAKNEKNDSRFKVSDKGDVEYQQNSTTMKAYVPEICLWYETSVGLATVSKTGRVFFFRRPIENCL